MTFFAKDFIETAENLIFAVVVDGVEQHKVLCFLRYVRESTGLKKYPTDKANAFLQQHYPDYLHYSPVLDAKLHAVPVERIINHHQPKQRLQRLLHSTPSDEVEQDLIDLCQLLQKHGADLSQCGITGSLLIGAQQHSSDIDLVCYERGVFQHCRKQVRELIAENALQSLHEQDWQASYQRRDCDLDFADYVWHEQRKFNKALINGRKFDLSLINPSHAPSHSHKYGAMTLQAQVIDDTAAFDYPAEFKLKHPDIASVVSFTATYTGQAITGETVEVSGLVEQNSDGIKRIVVGSNREAHGEYIKVIRC
jgi:predicted nucleotidyltransferase